jgi:hypothetical protein
MPPDFNKLKFFVNTIYARAKFSIAKRAGALLMGKREYTFGHE